MIVAVVVVVVVVVATLLPSPGLDLSLALRWMEVLRGCGIVLEGMSGRRQGVCVGVCVSIGEARGVGIMRDYTTALYVYGCLTYHDTIRRDETRYPGASTQTKQPFRRSSGPRRKNGGAGRKPKDELRIEQIGGSRAAVQWIGEVGDRGNREYRQDRSVSLAGRVLFITTGFRGNVFLFSSNYYYGISLGRRCCCFLRWWGVHFCGGNCFVVDVDVDVGCVFLSISFRFFLPPPPLTPFNPLTTHSAPL